MPAHHLSCGTVILLAFAATGQDVAPPGASPPGSAPAAAGEATMKLTIESAAFQANEKIPKKYTGEGADVSPPLTWSGAPAGTRELALLCDDPDAPRPEPWVHWVLYGLPAGTTALPENIEKKEQPAQPAGARQGKNSWSKIGYGGPMPPPGHGLHHYHFRLYALDANLSLPPGITKEELLKRMHGHILAEGELIGTYERK